MSLQTPLGSADLTAPYYGHDLFEPVDHATAWPDLRNRSLTETEREILLEQTQVLLDAVLLFDARITAEDKLLPYAPLSGEAKPPYIPLLLTDMILEPLHEAQRFLERRCGDETAVAYLRVADVLTRLLHTWRAHFWEEPIDELLAAIKAVTEAAPKEPQYLS